MDKKADGSLPILDGVSIGEAAQVTQPAVVQTLNVIAPADLKEGYQFEVDANGQRFMVAVPSGGVKEGQQFTAVGNAVSASTKPQPWKSGLFDCCRHGCCHPHFCLALWCPGIALAQVMTRMRLAWTGDPGSVQQVASTFKTVAGIFVLFLVLDYAMKIAIYVLVGKYPDLYADDVNQEDYQQDMMTSSLINRIRQLIATIFAVYFLVVTCRTRMAIREKHNIREESCNGCEDCCCSYWCRCCTIMQMMRQTADYDNHPASCCTETGLPAHINVV